MRVFFLLLFFKCFVYGFFGGGGVLIGLVWFIFFCDVFLFKSLFFFFLVVWF